MSLINHDEAVFVCEPLNPDSTVKIFPAENSLDSCSALQSSVNGYDDGLNRFMAKIATMAAALEIQQVPVSVLRCSANQIV